MGGKEESEMRGLSVFFIASILPSLIKGVGDIYGDFNEEGRWVKKGPLSPEEARPYDVDQPLFREKSEAQTCPRDGQAGCAFVDHVHTVRPFASPPYACSLHRRKGGMRADLRRRAHGPGDDHAQLHVGLHVWRDRQRADGVLREARPRPAHDARVDLLHVHQPAPSRRWPGRRELSMLTLGGESSSALAQARR
jgi:hypothetical protein